MMLTKIKAFFSIHWRWLLFVGLLSLLIVGFAASFGFYYHAHSQPKQQPLQLMPLETPQNKTIRQQMENFLTDKILPSFASKKNVKLDFVAMYRNLDYANHIGYTYTKSNWWKRNSGGRLLKYRVTYNTFVDRKIPVNVTFYFSTNKIVNASINAAIVRAFGKELKFNYNLQSKQWKSATQLNPGTAKYFR